MSIYDETIITSPHKFSSEDTQSLAVFLKSGVQRETKHNTIVVRGHHDDEAIKRILGSNRDLTITRKNAGTW